MDLPAVTQAFIAVDFKRLLQNPLRAAGGVALEDADVHDGFVVPVRDCDSAGVTAPETHELTGHAQSAAADQALLHQQRPFLPDV